MIDGTQQLYAIRKLIHNMERSRIYATSAQPKDPYKEMQNSLKRKMALLIILTFIVLTYWVWSQGRLYEVFDLLQIPY